MLSNFDLIWAHTKSLINRLVSSSENLQDEELYSQYCSAFEQLVQILENPAENVDRNKLDDIYLAVKALEQAYHDEQKSLQFAINNERMKARLNGAYLKTVKPFNLDNYDRNS